MRGGRGLPKAKAGRGTSSTSGGARVAGLRGEALSAFALVCGRISGGAREGSGSGAPGLPGRIPGGPGTGRARTGGRPGPAPEVSKKKLTMKGTLEKTGEVLKFLINFIEHPT